ncbi:MAG: hypothetical protein WC401_03805 [Bacteroidales bacterium]
METILYQRTRSIRFKLGVDDATDNKFKPNLSSKNDENLQFLIEMLEKVECDFKFLVFEKDKDGNLKKDKENKMIFFHRLKIKYTWMRNYMKSAFYDNRTDNPSKAYSLKDLNYVQTEICERWIPEWNDIILSLKEAQKRYKNKQNQFEKMRYSEIALTLNQLSKRSNLEFIRSFVDSLAATNKPDIDKAIEDLKDTIIKLSSEITKQQYNFLPYQSNGLVIAAGSFNFYTVNKSPKMLDDEKKKQEKILTELLTIKEKKRGNEFLFISETDINLLSTLSIKEDVSKLSLDASYQYIKEWKAKQKRQFIEAIQNNKIDDAKTIKLFESNENDFISIKERIQKIQELGNIINNKIKSSDEKNNCKDELAKIKEDKNIFFDVFKKKPQTPNYEKLCNLYKKVALKRGQIITKIRAIEKEKQIAEHLQYWCVILERNEHQYLYLIPRNNNDNLKKAKQYIDTLKNAKDDEVIKLHYFKSLTLRALRKLCFKEIDNSFKSTVKGVCFPPYEQKLSEPERIKFYQEILKNSTTIDIASFTGIDELYSKNFETIEDFENELNKICYVKTVCISETLEAIFKKQFKAISFEIKSQDIDRYIDEKINKATDTHKNKAHTKLWRSFWSPKNKKEQYPIRLNPEIKITYRDAKPSRIEKYGKDTLLYDEKKKNRYLHPQYTLITTITENAHNKKFDFAFCDTESIKNKIEEFSTEFNKNGKGEWYYGIDRGKNELATLCIAKFTDSNTCSVTVHAENNKDKKISVEFPENICLYELNQNKYYFKDDKKNETCTVDKGFGGPIKNISYYLEKIENEKWFKKITGKEAAAIDLTTAKVIKDNIILNGDLLTLQKLKMAVAKRQLFELFHKRKIDKTANIEKRGSDNLCIKVNNEYIKSDRTSDEQKHGMVIYKLTNDQKQNLEMSGQLIINELNQYIQKLDINKYTTHEPPIGKINHLRDAISANMVGVISFLNKKYKAKLISMENLDERKYTGEKFIESHFLQSQTSISRRFEWALYRSLQNEMLVPPNLKQTILLRDDFDQLQFGIIKFIKTEGTSSNCPSCCATSGKTGGNFICKAETNCGFSSKDNRLGLDPLTNSDKVAAFNIAKRGFEDLQKHK